MPRLKRRTISDLHRAFSDITAGDRSREILKKSSTVTVNNTINSQPGRGFLRGRKIPGGASVKTFDLKHYLRIFNRTKKEIIDPRNDLQPKTHRCKIILSEKWEETNCAQGFFYSEWSPGRSRVRCCWVKKCEIFGEADLEAPADWRDSPAKSRQNFLLPTFI